MTVATEGSGASAPTLRAGWKRGIWANPGCQVVIALVLGIAIGLIWPQLGTSLKILGDIFLRLIKTAIAPLVFLTVVTGIVSTGDVKRAGKVGLLSMAYFEVISTLALVLGLAFGHLTGIGKNLGDLAVSANAITGAEVAVKSAGPANTTFSQILLTLVPDNFIGAFARGELLQVLVIAAIFGFGLLRLTPDKRAPIERGLNAITAALFEFIHLIMRVAPLGAFGAIAYSVGSSGTAVLLSLASFVLAFYALTLIFIIVILGSVCAIFKINIFHILRYIRDEILIIFGTASSESVLPRLLEKLPAYGASRRVVGLVLPTGYAFNLDGTSMFMSMGVIFLANAYGASLTWQQELGILGIMLLTSKGSATVSGGSFVTFAATVTATGILPTDGLPLIFGVFRFLSFAIAPCNAIGNVVATIVVAKMTGEFDENTSNGVTNAAALATPPQTP
jgi:aerobic C4-dicarboxylate transport protein